MDQINKKIDMFLVDDPTDILKEELYDDNDNDKASTSTPVTEELNSPNSVENDDDGNDNVLKNLNITSLPHIIDYDSNNSLSIDNNTPLVADNDPTGAAAAGDLSDPDSDIDSSESFEFELDYGLKPVKQNKLDAQDETMSLEIESPIPTIGNSNIKRFMPLTAAANDKYTCNK